MLYIVPEASIHLITKDSALEYQNKKPEESNFKASILKPFGTCCWYRLYMKHLYVCVWERAHEQREMQMDMGKKSREEGSKRDTKWGKRQRKGRREGQTESVGGERKRKEGELAEGREKRRERQKGGGRAGRNLNIHWLKGYPVSIFSPKRWAQTLKFICCTCFTYQPSTSTGHLAGVFHGAPLQEWDKKHPDRRLVLGWHWPWAVPPGARLQPTTCGSRQAKSSLPDVHTCVPVCGVHTQTSLKSRQGWVNEDIHQNGKYRVSKTLESMGPCGLPTPQLPRTIAVTGNLWDQRERGFDITKLWIADEAMVSPAAVRSLAHSLACSQKKKVRKERKIRHFTNNGSSHLSLQNLW